MTDREIINAIANRLEMRAQQWRDSAKEHRDAEREERRILIRGAHRAAAQLADGLANGLDADLEWIDSLLKAEKALTGGGLGPHGGRL